MYMRMSREQLASLMNEQLRPAMQLATQRVARYDAASRFNLLTGRAEMGSGWSHASHGTAVSGINCDSSITFTAVHVHTSGEHGRERPANEGP